MNVLEKGRNKEVIWNYAYRKKHFTENYKEVHEVCGQTTQALEWTSIQKWFMNHKNFTRKSVKLPFKKKAQTALFKDPIRTAQ
jgi:hypothetical protein